MRVTLPLGAVLLVVLLFFRAFAQPPAPGAIHFSWQAIDFRLDSSETPQKHAPETMAGGVAVFDANNDGYPDIFFTNGADISSLKKTAPRYFNRLFLNDGHGHFHDATEKAGLAGAGLCCVVCASACPAVKRKVQAKLAKPRRFNVGSIRNPFR